MEKPLESMTFAAGFFSVQTLVANLLSIDGQVVYEAELAVIVLLFHRTVGLCTSTIYLRK
jgi:hypothetical protein